MGDDLRRSPGHGHGHGRILDDARPEGVATVPISCRCNPSLICYCQPPHPIEETPPGAQPTRLDHPASGAVGRSTGEATAAARDPFENLPPELLPTILSKLEDVKQAARTSILSTAWRHAWKRSPNLTLDIAALCGHGYRLCKLGEEQYVQRFMDTVDTILGQRCSGSVVEELELRFNDHHLPQVSGRLDDWIRYAASSQTKSVALGVFETPAYVYLYRRDPYELNLQLFDAGGGVSSLQHMLVYSVPLKMHAHTQMVRFPNLKSLALGRLTTVSASDFQNMLSNCPNLLCLDLDCVYLKQGDEEPRAHQPSPRLRYLRLVYTDVTKIGLIANNLTTFVFSGHTVPTTTGLGETPRLRTVDIQCFEMTLQQAASTLPGMFHMVQRLTLSCTSMLPTTTVPSPLENTARFPHLSNLQLHFSINHEHSDAVLFVLYFLESAPLLEELDINFVSSDKNGGEGPLRRLAQGQSEYKHLKWLRAREFIGHKDQLAFMIHVVENAPALEILTIDPIRQHASPSFDPLTEAKTTTSLSDIRHGATTLISEKLSTKTKFIVV